MKSYKVYVHRTNRGDVFYVGKGSKNRAYDLKRRNVKHLRIQKAFGCNVDIVWETEDEIAAFAYEEMLILHFGTFTQDWYSGIECNFTIGWDGGLGCKRSKETRKKMSEIQKLLKGTPEARELSSRNSPSRRPEVAAKMSASLKGRDAPNKGKPMSEEAKKKSAAKARGRKHSLEVRKKLSEIGKGRPWTQAQYAARARYLERKRKAQ